MFERLPQDPAVWMQWSWSEFQPYVDNLKSRTLDAASLEGWMRDWTRLNETIDELYNRLYVDISLNTADKAAEASFNRFLDEIYPNAMAADQSLKQKLLDSGLEPDGFEIPLRNLRAETALFREANLPLLAEEQKLATEYDKITGAQTVQWDGEERTVTQMRRIYQEHDRDRREQAWRLVAERQFADRTAINTMWQKLLDLRLRIAGNAGEPDYRSYRWKQMLRFDYTPADARRFHDAIESAVVPAALRVYERRRQQLGVDTLRPWDLEVDPLSRTPLKPFQSGTELINTVNTIFDQVDPQLGGYFKTMRERDLLDVENRKNKGYGAYCTMFARLRLPFIFANAVGIHDDVQTMLHESGHAFHVFESAHLPYLQQMNVPMEFAEVASMGMELLASPYLPSDKGGFYTQADANRALVEHLEGCILFWPYMAVVDAFQHWVYENPEQAHDPNQCDAEWARLWGRFMQGVDWSGYKEIMATGWHRKGHIHSAPFYYIEYGLAQQGAGLVWRNALRDQAQAIADYRRALSLGGTATLPQLFTTAGARLAFDAGTLGEVVSLMEEQIERLQA